MDLYDYQKAGVAFMLAHPKCILADEMGVGKTIQAIAVCRESPDASILVICPAGLRLNWEREFRKWAPQCRALEITSYEQAKKHLHLKPEILIVDEAHRIKNSSSARSKVVMKIAATAKRVMLLTGTPIPNGRPIELWNLLETVRAEGFRTHSVSEYEAYLNRYCGPRKICINKAKSYHPAAWRTIYDGATNLGELNERLKGTMLRRVKSEVLSELPEKTVQLVSLDCHDYEPYTFDSEDYDEAIRQLRSSKIDFERWSAVRHEQGLRKVKAVAEMVRDSDSEKLVVFVHHQDVGAALLEELRDSGVSCSLVTGATSMADRQFEVDNFQNNDDTRVLIASISAMGVGFTLTAAYHAIFAELSPVPGDMQQAEDRLHRIGQKRNVLIQHVVFDETIDANLTKMLLKKQANIAKTLADMAKGKIE